MKRTLGTISLRFAGLFGTSQGSEFAERRDRYLNDLFFFREGKGVEIRKEFLQVSGDLRDGAGYPGIDRGHADMIGQSAQERENRPLEIPDERQVSEIIPGREAERLFNFCKEVSNAFQKGL